MTTTPHPYPAYKLSGVEWLGDVPEHWQVRRLGTLLQERGEVNDDGYVNEVLSVLRNRGVIPYSEKGNIGNKKSEDITRYKIVRPDDIVVNCMNVIIGSVGLSTYTGCLSPVYYVLTRRSEDDDPQYLNAYFQTKPFQQSLVRIGNGILAHRMRIPMELLKCEPFPRPPAEEQRAIVRYLDHADRRIRRYVSSKRKLIALLDEEKQAIVNQAVTRGLDPSVRLKPSGVEWLGDVPEHWEVRRVKSLSLVKRGASPRPIADPIYFEDDGEYAWVRIVDVTASSHYLERTTQRLSRRGQSLSVELQPGALFLSIAGSVGKPIITKVKCCIHDGFVYFPQFRGNAEFLYRVFSCGAPFARLGKLGTQLNLNTETVGSICLGWPPFPEQAAIVEYLDKATADIDAAIARTGRQVELVQEYRTRLIADVVTGKLDVREAAAQLVEEDDEVDSIDEGAIMLDNMDGGSFDETEPTEEELAIESEVRA